MGTLKKQRFFGNPGEPERGVLHFILRMIKAKRLKLWSGLKWVGIESSYGYVWKSRVL